MIDEPSQPQVQNYVQTSPAPPPSKKPSSFLTVLGIVFFVLILVTSIILFIFRSQLKTTKNIIPTPTISSPSPTTIMKEEYVNPFAPTGTTDNQYNNPFEQTSNPFDELAKWKNIF